MKTVILGSGNVAEALAKAVAKAGQGVELVQIYARAVRGRELADSLRVSYSDDPGSLADADLYILAVSDRAIAEVAGRMKVPAGAAVVHTAGAVEMDAIPPGIADRGVFYPLQTFTAGRTVDFSKIPVFIEYSTPGAKEKLLGLAGALGSEVHEAGSDKRATLHAAAVFACNFTSHMYALAARIAAEDGFSFDVLKPLIAETAAKAAAASDPATVQTGPAVRRDMATMERHLKMLSEYGEGKYKEIYKLLSESIWETSKKI